MKKNQKNNGGFSPHVRASAMRVNAYEEAPTGAQKIN